MVGRYPLEGSLFNLTRVTNYLGLHRALNIGVDLAILPVHMSQRSLRGSQLPQVRVTRCILGAMARSKRLLNGRSGQKVYSKSGYSHKPLI